MYSKGEEIVSTRNTRIHGPIVGYGILDWEDGSGTKCVYLVKIAEVGSSLGPAVVTLDADYVISAVERV